MTMYSLIIHINFYPDQADPYHRFHVHIDHMHESMDKTRTVKKRYPVLDNSWLGRGSTLANAINDLKGRMADCRVKNADGEWVVPQGYYEGQTWPVYSFNVGGFVDNVGSHDPVVAKQIKKYKAKHPRPYWHCDIEALVASKVDEMLYEIQTKIDPNEERDLGGEADFFYFDDGTGFDNLKKDLTEKLASYIEGEGQSNSSLHVGGV